MIGSQYVRGNPVRYFPTNKVWATLSAKQSIPAGAWTKLLLDQTEYDVESEFDTTNKRFVAKNAGYYLIIAASHWDAPATGKNYWHAIATNRAIGTGPNDPVTGVYNIGQMVQPSVYAGQCAWNRTSVIVYLAVNDYIEVYVYNGHTAAISIHNDKKGTSLFVARLP